MDATAALLKQLTEAYGAPGHEQAVRTILRDLLTPVGQISTDKVGSLICRLEGRADGPRVMLAAHMDEIAFMSRHITDDGFIRVLALGGWVEQALIGHRVVVQTRAGNIPGVIGGMKPPHVQPFQGRDRGKHVPLDEMYVDIGATSRAEAEAAGVRPGDAVVPKSEFEELAVPNTYLAKAFDDRVGCALLAQALQLLGGGGNLPNVVYGVGTVMEEVGVRGVETALDIVEPDVAIVLEADVAGDTPNMTPEETTLRLGGGPSLLLFDPYLIPNHTLNDLVRDSAAALNLPLQMQMLSGGATDGAAIHLHKAGVPTIVLGVPTRHMHTHGMILHRKDYDCALSLLVAIVRKLDADTVAGLVRF